MIWSCMIVVFKATPSQRDFVVLLLASVELRYVIFYILQFNFASCVNGLIGDLLDF